MSDDDLYKEVEDLTNIREPKIEENISFYSKKSKAKILKDPDYFVELYDKLHTAFIAQNLIEARLALNALLNVTNNYICKKNNDFDNYSVASHLTDIAFTYDSVFSEQDHIDALKIIKNYLEIRSLDYAPSFLDLLLIPNVIGFFRIPETPKLLCLEVFKSIIYYSEEAAHTFLQEINYNEIIDEFREYPPNIYHILIQTFQILPFDEQPDEDFESMYNMCQDFLLKVFPDIHEKGFLDYEKTIGYGFDSLFTLFQNMCTNPERCEFIYKSYHFIDIINLCLKEADIHTITAGLHLLTKMVSIIGSTFPVVDFNSLMKLCEHSNEDVVLSTYEFLNTALKNSRDYYDYFRGCDIIKYMINFWETATFLVKKSIHQFICVYVSNADRDDKNKCMERGVIKYIVEGMKFDDEKNIIYAIDTILTIDDYVGALEYNVPFKRLNLQAAGISCIFTELMDDDDLSEEVKQKLEYFAENDETMKYLLENDDPTIDSDETMEEDF